MKDEIASKINKAFIEVIETMAFMFGDVIDKNDITEFCNDVILVEMTFKGDVNGSVSMIVPIEMCLEISANTLGTECDEALKKVRATDAVKELLNITCGQILTEIYGNKPVFDLSPPEEIIPDEDCWEMIKNDDDSLFYSVDDWFVAIKFKEE